MKHPKFVYSVLLKMNKCKMMTTKNYVTAVYDVTQDKSQTYRPVRASRVEKKAGQAGHGLYTQTPLNWR